MSGHKFINSQVFVAEGFNKMIRYHFDRGKEVIGNGNIDLCYAIARSDKGNK